MHMELACCEAVILSELENGCSQEEIAQTYAMAIVSSWNTDWQQVNSAITDKFGFDSLDRIKQWAWKIVESKGKWKP